MLKLTSLESCDSKITNIKEGTLLVIGDKYGSKKLFKVRGVKFGCDGAEVILSNKNHYFNWDMYMQGKSWVWRVWILDDDIEMNSTTNNMNRP